MNYKGNAFSTGQGTISDAIKVEDKIHFLQKAGSFYMHRVFDPALKTFSILNSEISFADYCWFYEGLLHLFGLLFKKE